MDVRYSDEQLVQRVEKVRTSTTLICVSRVERYFGYGPSNPIIKSLFRCRAPTWTDWRKESIFWSVTTGLIMQFELFNEEVPCVGSCGALLSCYPVIQLARRSLDFGLQVTQINILFLIHEARLPVLNYSAHLTWFSYPNRARYTMLEVDVQK